MTENINDVLGPELYQKFRASLTTIIAASRQQGMSDFDILMNLVTALEEHPFGQDTESLRVVVCYLLMELANAS